MEFALVASVFVIAAATAISIIDESGSPSDARAFDVNYWNTLRRGPQLDVLERVVESDALTRDELRATSEWLSRRQSAIHASINQMYAIAGALLAFGGIGIAILVGILALLDEVPLHEKIDQLSNVAMVGLLPGAYLIYTQFRGFGLNAAVKRFTRLQDAVESRIIYQEHR